MNKAKEVNSIADEFANTVYNNYPICKTIATKLDEFENWPNGLQIIIQTYTNSW